jgi:hypothetical protein
MDRFIATGYYYVALDVTWFKHTSDPFPLIEKLGLHYLDKYMFEMICKHYDIKYKFVTGVCFEGFNSKLKDLIDVLYNLRLEYKRKGSEILHVLKRLMNSLYGKSIQKQNPIYKVKVLKSKIEDFKVFNEHFISSMKPCSDGDFEVELVKTIRDKWTVPQFACSVLSYFKVKMAELAYECVDLGVQVYYINTHCLTMSRDEFDLLNLKHGLLSDELGKFSMEVESKLFIILGPFKNLHVLEDGTPRSRYPCKLENPLDFFETKFMDEEMHVSFAP